MRTYNKYASNFFFEILEKRVVPIEAGLCTEYLKNFRLESNPWRAGRKKKTVAPYKEVRYSFIAVLYHLYIFVYIVIVIIKYMFCALSTQHI
jgi:hypothetical protein